MNSGDPQWQPDVLPGYEALTLPLGQDDEGELVATLVRRAKAGHGDGPAAINLLYLHGWCDYFFQTHLADFWESLGVRFHALDLRKYGRSLRPGQTPGYVTSLDQYDDDIEAALAVIGEDAPLVLMGHSTGGLVWSTWVPRHPGRAVGLVLNSPWLEFQAGDVGRKALEVPFRVQAAMAPRSHIVNIDPGFYSRSISNRYDGEWTVDPAWRPDVTWQATPAWITAVFDAHEAVAHGLHIDIPILVFLSAKFAPPLRWGEDMTRNDTVINVEAVAQRVPWLGDVVTLVRLEGALHDVTLSAAPVRERLWAESSRWYRGYIEPEVVSDEPDDESAETPPPRNWWQRFISGEGLFAGP
ncbi:MAG: lysophospholipase [Cellulomonadaceae bacterium]|jgi:alpha-beta hydrolase superfamily lysophospholipase|nr:lysophospholipase [Cellulomonadaceae bacterium]